MSESELPFEGLIQQGYQEFKNFTEKFNIVLVGRTGVGKSTLLNAIFGEDLAPYGTGKPITQEIQVYSKPKCPITICDTKGLEMKDYHNILKALLQHVEDANSSKNVKDHYHCAWFCISEESMRYEKGEIKLYKKLSKLMPVIVIITKANEEKKKFFKKVKKKFLEAKSVIQVRAIPMKIPGHPIVPTMGLTEVVQSTIEVIPEAQQHALCSAQKVDFESRMVIAKQAVNKYAMIAAGLAAIPIPLANAITIIPVQMTMIAQIGKIFGLKFNTKCLIAFASSIITAAAGTVAVGFLLSLAMKFIPGVGTIVSAILESATAALLTKSFGTLFITILNKIMSSKESYDTSTITPEEVAEEFKIAEFHNR